MIMICGVALAVAIPLGKIMAAGLHEATYKVRKMYRGAPRGEVKDKEPQGDVYSKSE